MYQFQQTDLRSPSKKGGIAGNSEDELNFISLVEYQALENSARKFHVLALQELRDFWTGVRNQKSKEELLVNLESISELIGQTKKLYGTLMSESQFSVPIESNG